ncbi:CBS domain-containing protein [Marinitenerispora sediminis]|uniref:CBS domain-containing protein n=1 Tax=Marinitenerispora sediminis TaxID=1931232 RepID=A0A368SZ83_9ACTN|nr:CBS domain-containing protein [Marinitenerispora sediminis]RCV48348.1 CBS domain-containing protein [Marinitenerispora sediminis]RCV49884.1 CBS domain-containing protein [Marinitenerispora sediminis]RCV50639.1 CBS domain-containing protein [Marinitenerispora sediminis]
MANKVRDIMSSDLATIPPQASLYDAARIMRDRDIGDVIVTEGETPKGVVTDRDIVVRCVAAGKDLEQERVADVCSPQLTTVSPDADQEEAVRLMRDKHVRRLPVVENDRVVGVISIGDLARQRDPRSALADISGARPNK